MKLEDQVASLPLAKRLNELGIEQRSVFFWVLWPDNSIQLKFLPLTDERIASAFTVAELGEMLPAGASIRQETYNAKGTRHWLVQETLTSKAIYFIEDIEANARAKMLIYLIEYGLVKP